MPSYSKPHRKNRPVWHDLASRFTDDRECLASFIALEAAAIIAGSKPANLLNLVNHPQRCGRNLYSLWKDYGDRLLDGSGLTALQMTDRGDSLLLFIYRAADLSALLDRKDVAAVLRKSGYPEPLLLNTVLGELQSRIHNSPVFPHEIGVFLGYPLKDVMGFLGWAPLPFTCQGPWKIYGDPRRSLRLVEVFRECRCQMAHRLALCTAASSQFSSACSASAAERDLFCP